MFKSLEIAQIGQPILRQIAQPVENIKDESLQRLIDRLLTQVKTVNGVGIAAPQVSQSLRLFIVASHPNPRYPHAPLMEAIAMINPTIIAHSSEMELGEEGCLSIPDHRGLVSRYQAIEVEYLTRDGQGKRQELTGFIARIFQHELDHLNGILFTDHLISSDMV
jgi:peptide deformylase